MLDAIDADADGFHDPFQSGAAEDVGLNIAVALSDDD